MQCTGLLGGAAPHLEGSKGGGEYDLLVLPITCMPMLEQVLLQRQVLQ